MDASDGKYRPRILTADVRTKHWVIDGHMRGQARGPVAARGLSDKVKRKMVTDDAKRYMEDIPGRIAHMDELGIDVLRKVWGSPGIGQAGWHLSEVHDVGSRRRGCVASVHSGPSNRVGPVTNRTPSLSPKAPPSTVLERWWRTTRC